MARKPKNASPVRNVDSAAARTARRAAEPQWQKENQSALPIGPTRWFSAHEYTTSEDTLRTPKAEDKPGIGAPSARQEPGAVPNESDAITRGRAKNTSPNERPTRQRRRASPRPRRDAPARNRRVRKAR